MIFAYSSIGLVAVGAAWSAAAWRSRPASTCALRRARGTHTRRRHRALRQAPGSSLNAARCRRIASSATSNTPMPSTLEVVPVKYLSTIALRKTHRLEYLRAGVGHVGRDAHLRHDLHQALADCLDVILDALLAAIVGRNRFIRMEDGFHRQTGMDGFGAIAREQREVMHLARRAGFHHQPGAGAQTLADQMLVDSGQRQQRRNGDVRRIDLAVGHDQDVVAGAHRVFGLRAQAGEPRLDGLLAPGHRIGDVDLERLELAAGVVIDVADGLHLVEIEHRLADFEAHRRIGFVDAQQVGLRVR